MELGKEKWKYNRQKQASNKNSVTYSILSFLATKAEKKRW